MQLLRPSEARHGARNVAAALASQRRAGFGRGFGRRGGRFGVYLFYVL